MRGSLGNLGNKISLKKTFCLLQTWNDFKENCWGSARPTDALPGALMYWEGTELCLSNQEQVWQNWYWPAAGAFRKLWLLILSPPTPPPPLLAVWSYSYQPWGLCVCAYREMFLRYPVPPGDTVWLTCCWLDSIVRWLQLTLPHSSHGNSAEDAILLLNELAWHKAQCMQDLLTPDFLISIFYPLHPDQLVLSLSLRTLSLKMTYWSRSENNKNALCQTQLCSACLYSRWPASLGPPSSHFKVTGHLFPLCFSFFFTMNLPKVVV